MKVIAFGLLAVATCSATQYSYNIYNASNATFTPSNLSSWTQNGTIGANSSGGLESNLAAGGSIILPTSYSTWASQPDPTEYEVSMTLALKQSSGAGLGFVQYVHASENALSDPTGSSDAGTYDAIHLLAPTFSTDGYCSATMEFYERTSSGTTLRGSTPVPCSDGMVMRTVAWSNVVSTMINGQVYSFTSNLTGGAPGVGLYGANSPTGITAVQVGPRCMTVPNAIVASTVGSSAFPTNVSLHWQEPTQPRDVTTVGIAQLYVTRNPGGWNYIDEGTYYTDPNTTANTSYTYAMQEVSFHGVPSASTNISVTTPPPLDIDPRRTGVKPLGTYWGAQGENIDMLSGNLNFTMPLLTAQGRGGWTVPVSLSYNSQAWRKDPGGVWQLSQDVGYGFGWQLMAGSLTPYWNQNALTLDHFVYTDATGAMYRLYPLSTGSDIWTSQLQPSTAQGGTPQSGESVFVYYDKNANILHFKDGSFWVMGCISGGTEADAGTMYPTIIEDRNGNQILIRYNTGANANFPNSSSRISEIEDTRAVSNSPGPNHTYGFTYSAPDSTGVSHLASVTNYIGTGEFWNFTYILWGISDPFPGSGKAFGNVDELVIVGNNIPLSTSFKYDASGEMLNAYLPNGGYLRYQYQENTYSWGGIYQMAVSNRYLAQASNAGYEYAYQSESACTTQGQTGCVNESSYPITYTQATNNEPVISQTCLTDAADSTNTKAYRCWSFWWNTEYPWALGLPIGVIRQASQGAATNLTDDQIWWYTEPTQGNVYLGTKETITDEHSAAAVYSQQTQTVDAYGNVTQTKIWDYSTSSPGSTPTRTYTNYVYQPQSYLNAYLYNLPDHTVLTDANSNSVTLVQNTYDSYGTGGISNISSLSEHDSAYSNGFTTRGNVTKAIYPSSMTDTTYDITGTATGADDGHGHAVSVTTSAATNYSAPGTIQPNTGSPMDANLVTNLTYYNSLAVNTSTGPNGTQASATYDANSRPLTSVSVTGATTNYTYAFTLGSGSPMLTAPYTTTATTNTHWAKSVTDGLGRTLTSTAGYTSGQTSTTVSQVDTVYGPCACSPTGKPVQQSPPYKPGDAEYWTVFTFDGLGRTLTSTLPDGSKTQYSYLGNWTTVTDPAGNWKQYRKDAFGNILNVVEPDPSSPPSAPNPPSLTAASTLLTSYTYDFVNHLTGVTMTRTVNSSPVTQTRAFTYNASLQLASQTSPETGTATANGTTSYTYNADGTLATKVDPKGQTTSYSYDQYQRVSTVSSLNANYSYTYDADPLDYSNTFASNELGRVALVQWGGAGGSGCGNLSAYNEEYAYDIPGHVIAKRLTVYKSCLGTSFTASFSYDNEGKLVNTSYPEYNSPSASPTFSNVYDGMSRLVSVTSPESGQLAHCSLENWTVPWASGATYNAAGQLTAMQRFHDESLNCSAPPTLNYFNQAWQYNSLNQVTEIDTSAQTGLGGPVGSPSPGAASSFFARYHFSAGSNDGQITSVDDARLGYSVSYTYDALKRLNWSTASSPATWTQNYQYDGFGNITWKSSPPGSGEPGYPVMNSAKNQLSIATYDANGNTTSLNNTGFGYDGMNRMSTLTSGSSAVTYAYDENNRRIERNASSAGGNDEIYFYAPDGRLLSAFAYGFATPLFQRVYFGSMLIGATSSVANSDTYVLMDRLGTAAVGYAYGTDIESPGTGWDEPDFATYTVEFAGLEYANQRFYSAGYGRFMTLDQGDPHPQNPGSWNRYGYTTGDPINRTDPSGLDDEGPDPNTPPFGCDLFGGCVPGCPSGDLTNAFDPDSDLLLPATPISFCFQPIIPPILHAAYVAPHPASIRFLGATAIKDYDYKDGCKGSPFGAYVTEKFQILDQNGNPFLVSGLYVMEKVTNFTTSMGRSQVSLPDKSSPASLPSQPTIAGVFTDTPFGGCAGAELTSTFTQSYNVNWGVKNWPLGSFNVTMIESASMIGLGNLGVFASGATTGSWWFIADRPLRPSNWTWF